MQTPRLAELPPAEAIWLEIDTTQQLLRCWRGPKVLHECAISSGAAGIGQRNGSGKTPHGWHYVRAAIGDGLPENAVFRGRRWTGEVFTPELDDAYPVRDWILTRILWLCGLIVVVRWILNGAIFICMAHRLRNPWGSLPPTAVYAYVITIC